MRFIFTRMHRMSDSMVLQSKQVSPLPIGPGGNNALKNQMNDTNTKLTMLTTQADANTVYDPPVPKPLTEQKIEPFCSSGDSIASLVAAIGCLMIVYGFAAK